MNITDPSRNILEVNGKEVVQTDHEMREFYESFLEGHAKAYYNLSITYRELKNKHKKEMELLRSKLCDIIGKERTKLLFEGLDKK